MVTDQIKTSHDLADALEGVVKTLRGLPAFKIADGPGLQEQDVRIRGQGKSNAYPVYIQRISERLRDLSRKDAEEEINSLTLPEIRQIAAVQGIRVPSRATKSETAAMLLAQVFDMPAGQELIRTFHKRKAHSSGPRPKSLAQRR